MAYLKINNIDFSGYCNALNVDKQANYNARTNASGDTVVEYINSKRKIEVGIIPLPDEDMIKLQAEINKFSVALTYLNPLTNDLETINCIIPKNKVEYYTIQTNNVSYNGLTLEFDEL